jgi:hypothetical protein
MSHLEPRERQCLAHTAQRAGEDRIYRKSVTIQYILQWSATLGLIHFHEIWILALKKQGQCVSGGHALLAAS